MGEKGPHGSIEKGDVDELENMLRTMARMLIDHPDDLFINIARGTGFVAFEVICEDRDAGALIGHRGKHATAMRTLLMSAAAVKKMRVSVNFLSREHDQLFAR